MGIGAAYVTAKAAAATAVLQGISDSDFKRHYESICKHINNDNKIGKMIFSATRLIQKHGVAKRMILRIVKKEQNKAIIII